MIIDFHTHTYPEQIASRAIERLARQTNIRSYTDGTCEALARSQISAGIDYSVIMPVATKPSQVASINELGCMINKSRAENHLISFAAIHPDTINISQTIQSISANSFPGIKLHPMFQETNIDDIRYLNIIAKAAEEGLYVLIHGGGDINFPNEAYSSPARIKNMLDELGNPSGIIIAHMGGWQCWDEAFNLLPGYDVYLDTSSCLESMRSYDNEPVTGPFRTPITHSLFRSMVDTFGSDHILFGSDSPWGSQKDSLAALRETGLDEYDLNLICGENAARILNI